MLEAGDGPGAAITQWGHVGTFSPWPELVDEAAARLLAPTGWTRPESGYPTGRAWVQRYLAPLTTSLGERVRYGFRVIGVSRRGHDRVLTPGREHAPFVVHIAAADGAESRMLARAVIDASGTWSQPNPVGSDGISAIGERAAAAAGLVTYIPPTPSEAASWAGRHVVVIGSGHSAMTAVIGLAETVRGDPSTRVTWAIRRGASRVTAVGPAESALPQRGALNTRVHEAIDDGLVTLVTGFRTDRLDVETDQVVLVAEDGARRPRPTRSCHSPASVRTSRSCRSCGCRSTRSSRRPWASQPTSTPTCTHAQACRRTAARNSPTPTNPASTSSA